MKWGTLFDISNCEIEISKLEENTSDPKFWEDIENSGKVLQKIKSIRKKIDEFKNLKEIYDDTILLIEMSLEDDDISHISEIKKNQNLFIKTYDEMMISTLFTGEYDSCNAILSLHPGEGGTESCDWVSMLFRMYSRWTEKKDYKIEVLDCLDGDEAGIKSVTVEITGFNAYGFLKSEKGVHRLIRLSPFDSNGRRHTSFASCDIMPVIEDDNLIEIKTEDLRIDTYRSSGAGGQHVNTTDSAIRITHMPTGTVVSCQNERSQHKNKDTAMKMLRSKLFELKEQEREEKITGIRGEMKKIGFGSQIRTYVFHPYNLVKDHRTDIETGNISSVMDGNLDEFINGYLRTKN